jgi:hypothetical protein
MTWWTLLKQYTHLENMEHLLGEDFTHDAWELALNELDNYLGQYATVERPMSLHFMRAQRPLAGRLGKIKELTSMIRRMGTSGNLIIRDNEIELSREIDNINYSFNERVYRLLEKHYDCIYLNTNLNSDDNIVDKGYPRICLKPPEGANESLGDLIASGMSALETLMDALDNFQFFLEDVELWRRWGANGENLEGGLTENMPDYDDFRLAATLFERITLTEGESIPMNQLYDKIGYRYFTDGIFKFHSTYWTPITRGAEYSNRIVIPR